VLCLLPFLSLFVCFCVSLFCCCRCVFVSCRLCRVHWFCCPAAAGRARKFVLTRRCRVVDCRGRARRAAAAWRLAPTPAASAAAAAARGWWRHARGAAAAADTPPQPSQWGRLAGPACIGPLRALARRPPLRPTGRRWGAAAPPSGVRRGGAAPPAARPLSADAVRFGGSGRRDSGVVCQPRRQSPERSPRPAPRLGGRLQREADPTSRGRCDTRLASAGGTRERRHSGRRRAREAERGASGKQLVFLVQGNTGPLCGGDGGLKGGPELGGRVAHDAPISGIRRLTDAPLGSQNALTTPQVAPSVVTRWLKWHPYCALICHFLCQDWVPVPNQGTPKVLVKAALLGLSLHSLCETST